MITDKDFTPDRPAEFAVRRIHSAIQLSHRRRLTLDEPAKNGHAWTLKGRNDRLELELKVLPQLDCFLTYKLQGQEPAFHVLRLDANGAWPAKNAALELFSVATVVILLLANGSLDRAHRRLVSA